MTIRQSMHFGVEGSQKSMERLLKFDTAIAFDLRREKLSPLRLSLNHSRVGHLAEMNEELDAIWGSVSTSVALERIPITMVAHMHLEHGAVPEDDVAMVALLPLG